MNIWPGFHKRRCRNPVECSFQVTGYQRGEGPKRVEIIFRCDPEQRMKADLSVAEARALGRALMLMWEERKDELPKELMGPSPEEKLERAQRALRFIRQWFQNLEDGADDNDSLKASRLRVHAPIHKAIEEGLKS